MKPITDPTTAKGSSFCGHQQWLVVSSHVVGSYANTAVDNLEFGADVKNFRNVAIKHLELMTTCVEVIS